jgi:secreted PhoX family phosphatase
MLKKKSFRLLALPACIAAAILCSSMLLTGCNGDDGDDGVDGTDGTDGTDGITNYVPLGLKRLATAPLDAEFTGLYLNSDNTLFLNVQHPSSSNTTTDAAGKVFNVGTVGVIIGQDFSALPENFGALDLPITTAQKEVVMTAVGSYQVLTQQGDALDDGSAMGDIIAQDGTTLIKSSSDPDFNGVISNGNGGFYVYSNWEDRPGSMSRIQVGDLTDSGYTTIIQEGMVDFSSVGGTWVNCFGTVSPWDTPLSSEELYFDDTADWFDPEYEYFSNPQALATYFGYPTDGSGDWPNPYRYGYIVEIGNAADAAVANVTPNKLETMGRYSHENSVVMPDQRTVFLSDDGTGVVFFKFVADAVGDMSAGTLYAAQITQAAGVSDPAEAALGIEWIELASMSEADIEAAIDSFDGTFSDANYITDEQVCDWAESKTGTDLDCDDDATVDANPFSDDRVAYLESRKAAVALGATGEFRKMEGVNINYNLASAWWNGGAADGDQAYMYMAMSSFDKTMSDDEGAIQLNGDNGKCGVVYRMKLMSNASGEVDVQTMVPAIVGGPYYAGRSVNECNVNNISNPDNLLIMDDGRVIIGEDTGNHENNMIWVFDDPAI